MAWVAYAGSMKMYNDDYARPYSTTGRDRVVRNLCKHFFEHYSEFGFTPAEIAVAVFNAVRYYDESGTVWTWRDAEQYGFGPVHGEDGHGSSTDSDSLMSDSDATLPLESDVQAE